MLMEMSMKETGKMTKLMATESTCMPTGRDTKESGKKISSMERVLNDGPMEQFMMGSILKAKSMGGEPSNGATTPSSSVSLKTTTSRVMEPTNGTMVENITETGKTTKCMVKEFSPGPMAGNIQDLIKRI